jgi:putative ABC transport system permease protein
MESVWRDIRFSVRSLIKRPGFTLVAVLTIAIGVGANTAIFSVFNAVLLEPLPVHEPSELVLPDVIAPTGFSISLSIPNFRDWRDRNRSFESFGAVMGNSRTLTGGDRPEIVRAGFVVGDFFETLGVPSARGRVIAADETFEGAEPLAVITHGFSRRHFGDRSPLGESLTLDNQVFTVVGVMGREFAFPDPETEVYLPMGFFEEQLCWSNRGCSQGTFAVGRLAEGVTIGAAQQDLDRIVREIEAEEGRAQAHPVLESLADAYVGDVRSNLWLMMGAVFFVLLIACANVASLTLARGEGRRKEIALRSALGAGRGRVMKQFVTESMVLAFLGGAVGIALAWVGIRVLVPMIADALPSLVVDQIGLNTSVLLFTVFATALAGLLFGLAPALRVSRSDLVSDLKEGGGASAGGASHTLRASLVIAEVALSLILLIGAGLMVKSVGQLSEVDKGFNEDGIFTAQVALPRARYTDKEARWAFFRELRERVAGLPGVELASLTQILPLAGNSWEQGIFPEGVATEPENQQSVLFYMVTPEHFDMFEIPFIAGRGFEVADREDAVRVAIVDETMAERFWPGEDPIGKRVTFESTTNDAGEVERFYRTVVGVVKNVRHYELESAARITVYIPFEQTFNSGAGSMKIVAKTAGDPLILTERIRTELAALDPEVPLAEVETMEGYVDGAMSGPKALGTLLSVFGVAALALSAIGLFGLMSYTVAQRFREIGIRMALGATATTVVASVSGQALKLASIGVALGIVGALMLTRLMQGVLFGVNPLDVATFVGFSAFLLTVAAAAAWIPARRATRVDPAIVLRE